MLSHFFDSLKQWRGFSSTTVGDYNDWTQELKRHVRESYFLDSSHQSHIPLTMDASWEKETTQSICPLRCEPYF